ncbi:MAG: hypothetical protein V1833_01245 [Elusimicrobiota bacterium]
MGKKQEILTEIFKICQRKNDFIFHNDLVKSVSKKYKFGNPFDATKLDDTEKFPDILIENDYFIIHKGGGYHKFIKGIEKGFHKFEPIIQKNVINWEYKRSILNEYDTSESNMISVGNNQKIFHHFLYNDINVIPRVYNARRTKTSFEYCIDKEKVIFENIQMEIDFTIEYDGVVTIFEGKNGSPENFAIYQLFHPFKYFSEIKRNEKLPINQITTCYVLRYKENNNSVLRLYNYAFENEDDICSIKLLKNAQYNLIKK